MIRQVIFCGSFFDAGVKKLDTAFSRDYCFHQSAHREQDLSHLLVVVDSTLRFFKGGGDKDASLALAFVLGFDFAFMILSDCAEQNRTEQNKTEETLDIGSRARRLFGGYMYTFFSLLLP